MMWERQIVETEGRGPGELTRASKDADRTRLLAVG